MENWEISGNYIIFSHGNLEKLTKSHGNWFKKSGIPAYTSYYRKN